NDPKTRGVIIMALTFADTHNMITHLTKSYASEGFKQIIDFLNASVINYALTVNPTIYVSCIKQFWSSVLVKKVNEVVRLQAIIDRKKVIITEAIVREALHLVDAESIDCLPNEEIFAELARMRLVRKVDSSSKFYMYPRFLQLMISAQVVADDVIVNDVVDVVAHAAAKPTQPLPTPNTRPPLPQDLPSTSQGQEVREEEKVESIWVEKIKEAEINADKDVILEEVVTAKDAKVAEEADVQGRLEESQAQVYHINLEHADKVLSMQDDEPEPAELKEVIEVVTTAKLMTEVVTTATTTITATTITATPIAAATITAAPRRRKGDKGKGIMVEEPKPLKKQAQIEQDEAYARELEVELNKNINWDDVIEQVKRKEKKDNAVLRYQALKRKPQTKAQARKNMMVYLKNMAGFKMDYFKGMSYDDIPLIFEKYFNSNMDFLEKSEQELEEEASKALKRTSESSKKKATKKQKLDEEVFVVDYQIHTENNKPYYKIIRADGTHHLFLSFLSLLRNFDREDLEVLWQIVQDRFASSKPKNFSDDFLLTTLKSMFEKPDVKDLYMEESKRHLWFSKSQKLETIRVLWSSHHNF
nr:hypothetical protein [Tanacetum cinerariifolium]